MTGPSTGPPGHRFHDRLLARVHGIFFASDPPVRSGWTKPTAPPPAASRPTGMPPVRGVVTRSGLNPVGIWSMSRRAALYLRFCAEGNPPPPNALLSLAGEIEGMAGIFESLARQEGKLG